MAVKFSFNLLGCWQSLSVLRFSWSQSISMHVWKFLLIQRSRFSFVLVYDADRFWTHTGGTVRSSIHRRRIFLNEKHKRTKYLRSSQILTHRRAKICNIDATVLQHRRTNSATYTRYILSHTRGTSWATYEPKTLS